jgi:hypothetical protein
MINLHVAILVIAIVVRMFWRPRGLGGVGGGAATLTAATRADAIHVVACFDIRDPWREHVTRIITTCSTPVRFSLLLRCNHPEGVHERDAIDSILSPAVHIEIGIRAPAHPNSLLRHLVRKFVSEDEQLVVFLGSDAIPVVHWDEVVRGARSACTEGGVISSPTSALDGGARFPTLRRRSNGSVARNTSESMKSRDDPGDTQTIPSVCWCPEVTVFTGRVAHQWSAKETVSYVDQTMQDGARHFVFTRPVLEHSDRVEDDMIDFDEGSSEYAPRDCEFVGLTRHSTGEERIRKYETLFHARLVVQMKREEERRDE